ncbi:MAG TPA: diguanylate cyclase [Aquabacterium sp.]|nr:diguanylate cyclase [Aquabacterium sp.]
MSSSNAKPEIDRITALAAGVFGMPVCLVAQQQRDASWHVISSCGTHLPEWPLPDGFDLEPGVWRALSDDASNAPRFPSMGHAEPKPLRFVAVAPIETPTGTRPTALMIMDWVEHPEFSKASWTHLTQFAAIATTALTDAALPPDPHTHATQERLQLALESAQMGTWDFDFETKDRIINHRTAAMLGLAQNDPNQTTVESWLKLVHPQDRHKIVQATQVYRKGLSDIISIEYRIRHQAGHDIWVQSYGKLVERNAQGRPKRVVGTLRDITEQKRQELQQQKQRQLLDLINQAQATFLLNHDIKDACEALFEALLKLSDCQFGLIGIMRPGTNGVPYLVVPTMTWDTPDGQGHRSREYLDLDNALGRVVTHNETVQVHHASNQSWPEGIPSLRNFLGIPIRFDRDVVGLIGLGNRASAFDQDLQDLLAPLASTLGTLIHARQQEEARMEAEQEWLRLATEDTLTGLPNRRHFFDVAETCLLQSRRYGNPMTVALLDLDNFKQINDTYGHSAGDEVLRVMADILRQVLRDSDTPARIGGEEFAVILTSTTLEDAVTALERIRATLSLTPITMGHRTLHATVSIGAVQWHEHEHDNVHSLLVQADSALYRAKRRGRNRVEIHHPYDAEPISEPLSDSNWGSLGLA